MILDKLHIERVRWGDDEGKHKGEVRFINDSGAVEMVLKPEMIEQIFKLCANGIIEVSKEAAESMTCQVIEHKENLLLEE